MKANAKKSGGKIGKRGPKPEKFAKFTRENGKVLKEISVDFPNGDMAAFANAFVAAGRLIQQAGDLDSATKILAIVAEIQEDQRVKR